LIPLLRFIVKKNMGDEVLRIMDEAGLSDRWRPVGAAVTTAIAKDATLLNGVAPEVRLPAFEILKDIAPDLVGDTA
jgi:hypothetical protein